MTELARVRKYRTSIPKVHQESLDTRLRWLWHQRFGSVQMIWQESKDTLDHTACTVILQAIMAQDLASIELLMRRLEGSPVSDTQLSGSTLRI